MNAWATVRHEGLADAHVPVRCSSADSRRLADEGRVDEADVGQAPERRVDVDSATGLIRPGARPVEQREGDVGEVVADAHPLALGPAKIVSTSQPSLLGSVLIGVVFLLRPPEVAPHW